MDFSSQAQIKSFIEKTGTLEALVGHSEVSLKSLNELEAAQVAGGGTQSKGYLAELTDGSQWFIREKKNHNSQQSKADAYIKAVLGDYAERSPFVFSKLSENQIDVFPLAKGKIANDFITKGTENEKDDYALCLGHALGQVHVQGLTQNNSMEALSENDGVLTINMGILIHPDFQNSNIIFNAKTQAICFIDTEGIERPNIPDPYLNLSEALESFQDSPTRQNLFLSAYLSSYPKQLQKMVLDELYKHMKQVYPGLPLPESAKPSLPIEWKRLNQKPSIKKM